MEPKTYEVYLHDGCWLGSVRHLDEPRALERALRAHGQYLRGLLTLVARDTRPEYRTPET